MKKTLLIVLMMGIGPGLTSCSSNPVAPPLPIPEPPRYEVLSQEELDLLSKCREGVCEVYHKTLMKLLKNKTRRETYIDQLKGSLEATQ
ncbi:MAG: hypothetical protein GWN13_02845 [Phycisphaerae bacterium]|nr:hypothetical protein [Phycisphaerae bacterium]